jgi:hypothetical protein
MQKSSYLRKRDLAPVIEPLERRQLMAAAAGTATPAPPMMSRDAAALMSATASVVASPRVYLTGNSMTDGVRYNGLVAMLGRNGAPVTLGRQTGPGYAQAYNLNLKPGYWTSGVDPAKPGAVNPWGNYQQAFAATSWDALTLQLNDRRLLNDGDPKNPSGAQNQAEVPISIEFMKRFAANSPSGQVFAYSRPVRRTDLNDDGTPSGIAFNYSAEYLKTYVESGTGRNFNITTRSFTTQYMQLVRSAQQNNATTKNMKPIRLIPVADAYYNIDQMIKAGKFAGTHVKSIMDLYVDKSHPSDTGAYVIALTFYSSLTGQDPRGVTPPGNYTATAGMKDPKVQALLQQAVYDAITYKGYAGWTTPMPTPPPPTTAVGSIRMTVYNDLDRDGVRDSGEAAWANVKVFIDTDNDGKLDAGEKSATTNTAGQATFGSLPVGPSYRVRIVPPSSTKTTSANPVLAAVTANGTRDVRTGLTKLGSISGRVFSDDNKNGRLDTGEALLSGRTVFIDLDGDNRLDTNEKRTTTDANGNFKFTGLVAGAYRIRRVFPGGYRLSTPAANVALAAGQNFSGVLIGAGRI